jgi:hypothetical protein
MTPRTLEMEIGYPLQNGPVKNKEMNPAKLTILIEKLWSD